MGIGAGKGGGAGGKGGGGSVGLSPQQMALAQFTQGQQALKASSDFSERGMGLSTGETQASGGSLFEEAAQMTQMENQNLAQLAQQQSQAAQAIGGQGFNQGFNTGGTSDSTSSSDAFTTSGTP